MTFERDLERNIFALQRELKRGEYRHGPYSGFYVTDPKMRHIHKAMVRDRIVHHAVYAVLATLFEETFICNSFSCRIGYGTHRGVAKLKELTRQVSKNNSVPCYALKCDIRKFFDSIDHAILIKLLRKRIKDERTMGLLEEIIGSFTSARSTAIERKGLPLGNLTSQLFANIYMNEFDQFVKHDLHVRRYIRYTDDFIIVDADKEYLQTLIPRCARFLDEQLSLTLHPKKIEIKALHQGVDFLGYITFPHHRLVRTKTKRRMAAKLHRRVGEYEAGRSDKKQVEQSLRSYLGVLSHANTHELAVDFKEQCWFLANKE